jgi:nucleoside-diphosphate-sugar epimerase
MYPGRCTEYWSRTEDPTLGKKILVVGGAGTIGRAVVPPLSEAHEVIPVGRSWGDHQVDITDGPSIKSLFERVG